MGLARRLPRPLAARALGIVYLIYFLVAFLGGGLHSHPIVLISDGIYVGVTLLFFLVLRSVNQPLAILATACSLVGQVLAVLFDKAAAGLVADGAFLILLGALWFRSRLIPRPVAVLLIVAGVGWLAFAWPGLSARVGTFIEVVGAVAELALMLWLVIKGIELGRAESPAVRAESHA